MKSINSPIQTIIYKNEKIYVKRDDLLDEEFSGNKARKFYHYLQMDFSKIKKIISFGSAQANSLYSLSVLAKIKNVKFDFYVKHINETLKDNPCGNYKAALSNGANILIEEANNLQEYIETNILQKELGCIFIEEGGRVKEAEVGIKILAQELLDFVYKNDIKNPKVILPSGTGTTSLFLQKNLPFEVLTCTCVGSDEYLKKQFFHLEKNEKFHPKILKQEKKYHFGKLYNEFYFKYLELIKDCEIEFDLLYDPLCFIKLEEYLKIKKNNVSLIYIHQGGILGNTTMIERYKRKLNLL